MKRLLACVSLIAATTTAASPASPVSPKPPPPAKRPAAPHRLPVRVAPADEYFGKLKLSVLGIRNTIRDVGLNIDIEPVRYIAMKNKVDFAVDAIHDWEKKYPTDTWLPKTVFALERMYAKLDTDDGRALSMQTMRWLVHDFPNTWYGKTGRREIAEHRVGHPITAAVASPAPDASASLVVPTVDGSPAPAAAATSSSALGTSVTVPDAAAVPSTAPDAVAAPSPEPVASTSPSHR